MSKKSNDEALSTGSLLPPPAVSNDVVENVIFSLSNPGRQVGLKAVANSCLFQAINASIDYLILLSVTHHDELQAERLLRRAYEQSARYHSYREDALTYATTEFDKPMAFQNMWDLALRSAPPQSSNSDDYDPSVLEAIGLDYETAVGADIEQAEKDAARFEVRREKAQHLITAVRDMIAAVPAGTPDIHPAQAVKLLGKIDQKLSEEPLRLWKVRSKVPTAMGTMMVLKGDITAQVAAKAANRIRKDFEGDDRVRFN